MGFFKSIFKGVKKVVKGIGKAIKKVVKPIGKVVGKLGVVGQIGLMFALPAIGGWLASGVGALAGASNPLLAGVGRILTTAGKFASTVGNVFKTVTNGITGFIKNVGGSFINKSANLLGVEGSVISSAPQTVTEGFQRWAEGVVDDVSNITSPFRDASVEVMEEVASASEDSYERFLEQSTGEATEEAVDPLSIEFNQDYEIPELEVVKPDSPLTLEVNNPEIAEELMSAENSGIRGYMSQVRDYAVNKARELPERALDVTSNALAGIPGRAIEDAAGLGPKAPQITQVSNVIPSFDFQPVSLQYEAQGLGYGATPQNRVTYMAASQMPFGDFGSSSFRKFSSQGIA